MSQAAKLFDVVIGVDVHLVMVPSPAGPVPTPLPHAFVGYIFDPMAWLNKVHINGLPAATTGTWVRAAVKHLPTPPGTSFAPNDIPGNNGAIVSGSKTVLFGGSAARTGSMVTTCGFPVNLPTSTVTAVAGGKPVLVGGPDAMDWAAAAMQGIRTKWFSNLLHKVLKPGKWLSKILCALTGHPVDVMSGRVLADAVDFELPGPIPIVFERNYDSRDRYEGPLGPAWHHPLDASVNEYVKYQPLLEVRLPDGRRSPHDALEIGASVWEPIDRYTLARTRTGYRLTFWNGLTYHFEPVQDAHVTHPLVKITDRCGNCIELRYAAGRLVQVIDSVGRVIDFVVDGGRLRSVRLRTRDQERINLVRYAYNEEGRLAVARDPAGHACTYAYKGGVLVKETNRNGLSFSFEYQWYDPDGWCVHTWGDGGIYDRKISYDEANHVTVVDDGRGGRTQYHGNDAGLVEREIDPMGVETRHAWHPKLYQKTAQLDALGHRTEWAYDERGNLILERDALGHETRWTYNELNLAVERIDAAGSLWRREYDRRGLLMRDLNPLGDAITCKHDARGNLIRVEDALGHGMTLQYTEAGELCEVIDAEGHKTRVEVDDRGLLSRHVDALGGVTKLQRDACGRVVMEIRPDGSVLRAAYDPEGNLTAYTDALGDVTRFEYGGLNKLMARTDPAGGVVRVERDTEEDVVAVINEAGERYQIERDVAGRVVKERGFDGRVLEVRYDRGGRVNEMVNAQEKRTRIWRDPLGRVVKHVVPRKPVLGDPIPEGEAYEYAYDALGGLVRAKNDAAEVTFLRDTVRRVIAEQCDGVTVASAYDAAGRRVGVRTSLGHEARYDFDGNDDLAGVSFGRGAAWGKFGAEDLALGADTRAPWRMTFARDAAGNELERHLPGGLVSRWQRGAMGLPRQQRIEHSGARLSVVGYKWKSAEQLAGLIDPMLGPTWFEHDPRGYLTSATRPDGTVQYRAVDEVGNVYRSPARDDRVYVAGGRLGETGGVKLVHNADGELIENVLPDGRSWKYAWDFAGQLVEVTRPDGQTVSFAYDALARRVRKRFAGKTTRYVWDGDDLVHEIAEGAAAVTWVFEPGTFAPLAKEDGGRRYGVVTDHLGTPRILADEAGALAWKARLDLYGAAQCEVSLTGCPWRWPGQYEDEETGLYYNRFRYYDPEAGRYICQDPILLDGGVALYAYVPDPLVFVDPYGLVFGIYEFAEGAATYIGSSIDTVRRFAQHEARGKLQTGIVPIATSVNVFGATGKDAIRLLRLAEQDAIRNAGGLGPALTNQINAVAAHRINDLRKLEAWYQGGQVGPRPKCK